MDKALFLALFLVVVLFTACASSAAAKRLDGLDLPDDFFPIMPWDCGYPTHQPPGGYKNWLDSVAECNFTLTMAIMPDQLPAAEKAGLRAVMMPPTSSESWQRKWKDVLPESADAAVKQWVDSCGGSKAVAAYHVTDEPGTPKFAAIAEVVKAIRKYAPGKLAYVNLFPGHATIGAPDQSQLGAASYHDYLEQFVEVVKPQIISYDNYMTQYSDDFQNQALAAKYFEDLVEVRRVSLEHRIPFWNVVSSNQIRPATPPPSPENMFVQAYTTLAAGGRGIAWYTYYSGGYGYGPVSKQDRRNDSWTYLQMVNGEIKVLGPLMNRLQSIGLYFSKPWPSEKMPQLPGRIVRSVTSRVSVRGFSDEQPPLMIGEFKGDDGSDYVMAVNLSLQKAVNFLLETTTDYGAKEVVSAQDAGLSSFDEKNGQWLVPGKGALIKLSPKT